MILFYIQSKLGVGKIVKNATLPISAKLAGIVDKGAASFVSYKKMHNNLLDKNKRIHL